MSTAEVLPFGSLDQPEIRFLVEQCADGVILLREDGVVLFANPAAEQVFGRSQKDLIGSPLGIPLVGGETTEITVLRPCGDQVDTEIRTVETNWSGRTVLLASLRDISARKVVEENLRHSAKMEAVGQLTAGIAHDFNNLLTVVLGNLEIAQRRFNMADPELLSILENATHGAKRAASLTERLLAFARRKPLEPDVVDANALVAGMSDLLRRTLGDGITVRTELASDIWTLEADPTELEAAILNLAVNARDAMLDGGELLIETANVEIGEGPAAGQDDLTPGAYVAIFVTDTGTGMPKEVLKRAFDPFFTTKADGRGTGLGLSQIYGFARQSGGHVRLYSEPGIGTTARIYLPRATETDAAARPRRNVPPETIPRAMAGEAILVVEDNDDVRSYTVGILRELGYTVREAAHAASALRIIESDARIDVLLTDLGLPGGTNGKELADRAKAIRPTIRMLITTAYAGHALVHQGRLDPGIELLTKPFALADLASRIRTLLKDSADGEVRKVLVVEDEFLIRDFIASTLNDHGFDVEQAGDYGEAWAKLEQCGSTLAGAIVDVGLPDRPGDEFADQARKMFPQLPVILATGFTDSALQNRFAALERIAIIAKPFDADALVRTLKRFTV
jgi:signal transduction histidine kinase/CheY-like chemotaxis protein